LSESAPFSVLDFNNMEPTDTTETEPIEPVTIRAKTKYIWLIIVLWVLLALLSVLFISGRKETAPRPPVVRPAEVDVGAVAAEKTEPISGPANLSLSTVLSAVSDGDTFTVTATVDPNSNRVNGAELEVVFDPSQLELEKVEPSDTFSLQLESVDINNEKGMARFAFGVPLGQEPVDAPTPVALLSFVAKAVKGLSTITVSKNSLVAAAGLTSNVLGSTTPAVVEILE